MRNIISCFCLAISLLLFCQSYAQQKSSAGIHGDKQKFGVYYASLVSFKEYFANDLPSKAARGFNDQIYLSSYDWKQWTEEDLRKLATSENSVVFFASLSDFKNTAAQKDVNGQYTGNAICAQNVLTELKPNACKSWKAFFNMIIRVEKETERVRIPLMKREHIRIPG